MTKRKYNRNAVLESLGYIVNYGDEEPDEKRIDEICKTFNLTEEEKKIYFTDRSDKKLHEKSSLEEYKKESLINKLIKRVHYLLKGEK